MDNWNQNQRLNHNTCCCSPPQELDLEIGNRSNRNIVLKGEKAAKYSDNNQVIGDWRPHERSERAASICNLAKHCEESKEEDLRQAVASEGDCNCLFMFKSNFRELWRIEANKKWSKDNADKNER